MVTVATPKSFLRTADKTLIAFIYAPMNLQANQRYQSIMTSRMIYLVACQLATLIGLHIKESLLYNVTLQRFTFILQTFFNSAKLTFVLITIEHHWLTKMSNSYV